MSCNENNKSLLRLQTNENNEIVLVNKKGEVISRVQLCDFIINCNNASSLTLNELTGTLTYKNNYGELTVISMCDLFDICHQSNIPPFCIVNMPTKENPTILPNFDVLSFGCEGVTLTSTNIRVYNQANLSTYNDILVTTPVDLSFLCGMTSVYKVELINISENSCGIHTSTKELSVITDSNHIIVEYLGVGCCTSSIIDDIRFISDDLVGDTEYNTTASAKGAYAKYINRYVTMTREYEPNKNVLMVSYKTKLQNGYTSINVAGEKVYNISNDIYGNCTVKPSSLLLNSIAPYPDYIGLYVSNIKIPVNNAPVISNEDACNVYIVPIAHFPIIINNATPTIVNVFDLVPQFTITPANLNFINNSVDTAVFSNRDTGIVTISPTTIVDINDIEQTRLYFTIVKHNDIYDTEEVVVLVVLDVTQ